MVRLLNFKEADRRHTILRIVCREEWIVWSASQILRRRTGDIRPFGPFVDRKGLYGPTPELKKKRYVAVSPYT